MINSIGVVGLAMYPLGGHIADRVGRVKLLGYATYGLAISYIFFIVAEDWRALAVGLLLQQIALFYTPALNALLADSLPPRARGRGFALERTFPAALGIVAPYLGGLAITHYGGGSEGVISAMRLCYMGTLLMGLLVATLRLFLLKETISVDTDPLSIRDFPSLVKEAYRGIPGTIKLMPSSLRPIVYLQIIQSFSVSMVAPFWILYASEALGLTALDWGTILLYSGMFGLAFILPAGYIVDRFGSKPICLLSLSTAGICAFLFIHASSFWGALIVLILLLASNQLVAPSFASLIANLVERKRRGRVYALIGEMGLEISTSRMFGGGLLLVVPASLGGFLGGYLYTINPSLLFIILAVTLLLGSLIVYRFVREPKEPEM